MTGPVPKEPKASQILPACKQFRYSGSASCRRPWCRVEAVWDRGLAFRAGGHGLLGAVRWTLASQLYIIFLEASFSGGRMTRELNKGTK